MEKIFPVFKTGRLLLRQFKSSDLENVFLGLSNPQVTKYYGVHFNTLEEAKKQIEWFAELEKNETGIWWAICSLDGSRFFGAVGVYYLEKEFKKAEIGFWVIPEYWGQGITSESALLALKFAFEKMGLRRIEAEVETENIRSIRMMKKLKFVSERIKKDCEIKNGKYISLQVFVMDA